MTAELRDSLAQVVALLETVLYRADLVSDQVATAAAEGGMHPDYPAIERLCERTTAYQEAYAAFEPYKAEFFALLKEHGPALLAVVEGRDE